MGYVTRLEKTKVRERNVLSALANVEKKLEIFDSSKTPKDSENGRYNGWGTKGLPKIVAVYKGL